MALTGLGRDSVYKAIRARHLPARKLGRRTLILASDLQTFLSSLPTMGAA
jgi:excisionase family DNA binding protein